MRPIDLARAAGISTQQVRNHEAAGLLPPTPRTASGYRTYGPEHVRALLAYRALAAAHGIPVAAELVRHVLAGRVAEALRLLDASHADLDAQRRETDELAAALDALARAVPRAPTGAPLSIGELARSLGVRPSALRVWETAGLLEPVRERGERRYGAVDIRDARIVRLLRQGHYPLPRIRPVLDALHRTGGPEALREAIEERRAAHDRRARAMLHAAARLNEMLDAHGEAQAHRA
ncbi:MerR family transcriptional regulator [Pseudonocardia xishanensis]|uniref:MerR family transcriptional regulator n=1 Tax=Pseudonocardia xishanensis TaxID=630995 RepID=A0ABP8RL71_9PSEU